MVAVGGDMELGSDKRVWLAAAYAVVGYLALRVLQPVLPAVVAAATIAPALHGLQERFSKAAPRRRGLVAGILTALAFIALAVPTAAAAGVLLHEAIDAFPAARQWALEFDPRARGWIVQNLDSVAAWSAQAAALAVRDAVAVGANLIVFAATLFLLLRDGAGAFARAAGLLPLPPRRAELLFARVREVLRATVYGVLAVALAQGLLAWAGLAIFGVPFSGLLAVLAAILSPIPFLGLAAVCLPVAGQLAWGGDVSRALGLVAWFALIVGPADNLLRSVVVGTSARVPIALVLVSAIGGVGAFGVSGAVIGPVVAAVLLAASEELPKGN